MMTASEGCWLPAARAGSLPAGELHVWRTTLDTMNDADLWNVLSEEERLRANRFHFSADRRRFANTRGILRRLLGGYLGRAASELTFGQGAAGKPALADAVGAADVRFNVSHSGSVALFAFACGVEVGVDVESCRPEIDACGLAERFFSQPESQRVRSAEGSARLAAFYACWTRKEACLKALGTGLALELASFSVLGAGDANDVVSVTIPTPAGLRRVSLRCVPAIADYDAAVAWEGDSQLQIRWFAVSR
jgi:4'-phosphopantetheinyl transferase